MSELSIVNRLLCSSLGKLARLFSVKRGEQRLLILIFHRVLDSKDFMRPSEPDIQEFTWKMELLSKYFNVLPFSEAVGLLEKGELPARSVAITFDDGYADNLINAVPILQRYDLSAIFFIASSFLDGGRMWNDTVIEACRSIKTNCLDLTEFDLGRFDLSSDSKRFTSAQTIIGKIKYLAPDFRQKIANAMEAMSAGLPNDLMLTKKELCQLANSGMEVGGHTVTHPILSTLCWPDATCEVEQGKKEVESIVDKAVIHFAYPNGKPGKDYLAGQTSIVSHGGFKTAVSTQWGLATPQSDIFQLPRFSPWDKKPSAFMFRLLYSCFYKGFV